MLLTYSLALFTKVCCCHCAIKVQIPSFVHVDFPERFSMSLCIVFVCSDLSKIYVFTKVTHLCNMYEGALISVAESRSIPLQNYAVELWYTQSLYWSMNFLIISPFASFLHIIELPYFFNISLFQHQFVVWSLSIIQDKLEKYERYTLKKQLSMHINKTNVICACKCIHWELTTVASS